MTITIAVAGKGGTGKTTFSALTIKYLQEMGHTPILAIDGDPSSNLNLALGFHLEETIGQMREDTQQQVSSGSFPQGISKPDWFDLRVSECLVEGEGVDLLAMGRPEGPGCYCAANNMLRRCIDELGSGYAYVVIDNEAGMEHISRQTTRNIDYLFIVSDPSHRGLAAVEHIVHLTKSLGTRVAHSHLVINNVKGELPQVFLDRIAALDVNLLGTLPSDPKITEFDVQGESFMSLDDSSLVYAAIRGLLSKVL